jgi:hypothetical protein
MLHLSIDYTLADKSAGTFSITVLNKNSGDIGRVQYSIEAASGLSYGSLEGYWAWSESPYTCAARVIHKAIDFLHDHFGRGPVEALNIHIAGVSPYGGTARPVEMSRITFRRLSSGNGRATADGDVCRGIWPLPMEKSNADLPWQLIFILQRCDNQEEIDFADYPGLPLFREQLPANGITWVFLDELPIRVQPWLRVFSAAFFRTALRDDGRMINRAVWDDLVRPLALYHRAAAMNRFTNTHK